MKVYVTDPEYDYWTRNCWHASRDCAGASARETQLADVDVRPCWRCGGPHLEGSRADNDLFWREVRDDLPDEAREIDYSHRW